MKKAAQSKHLGFTQTNKTIALLKRRFWISYKEWDTGTVSSTSTFGSLVLSRRPQMEPVLPHVEQILSEGVPREEGWVSWLATQTS